MIAHGGTIDPFDLVWMNEDDEVMRRVMNDPESAHAGCGGVYTAVVTRGKRALLARLLDAGVKVNPVAGGCQSYLLEHPGMLRQLLARGGLTPDYPTTSGLTLLHNLCQRDVRDRTMRHRTECAAVLLDAGANISARGRVPIDAARVGRPPQPAGHGGVPARPRSADQPARRRDVGHSAGMG